MPSIEDFCHEEIKRQRDTGDHHAAQGLIQAWRQAVDLYNLTDVNEHGVKPIEVTFIEDIGFMAKPYINSHGFRRYPISIGWVTKGHHDIHYRIWRLVDAYNEGRVTPQELYMEYEDIHPFGDGNGRTGKILFNWANGTLENPVMPENPYGWEIP